MENLGVGYVGKSQAILDIFSGHLNYFCISHLKTPFLQYFDYYLVSFSLFLVTFVTVFICCLKPPQGQKRHRK